MKIERRNNNVKKYGRNQRKQRQTEKKRGRKRTYTEVNKKERTNRERDKASELCKHLCSQNGK